MNMVIQVKDYFKPKTLNVTSQRDRYMVMEIRNQLNSFPTMGEQYAFLAEYRSSKVNREFDKRVFGMPENAKLYECFNHEKKNANKYYNNVCTEVELNHEEKKAKRNKNAFKAKIMLIGAIISCVWGLVSNMNKYGGLLGLPYVFQHTPFGICSLDLNEAQDRFVKTITDPEGRVHELPGRVEGYAGWAEEVAAASSGRDTDEYGNEIVRSFSESDWTLSENERGLGKFGVLEVPRRARVPSDLQDSYVIAMRWDFCDFYIESVTDGKPVLASSDVENRVDIALWLSQQQVMVFNTENYKSVVCSLKIDDTAWWQGSDPDTIGVLSEAAITDLGYDPNSDVLLDVYFLPPDLGEVRAGLLEDQLVLQEQGCELLRTAGGRGGEGGALGNAVPPVAGYAGRDGGMSYGWVADSTNSDWKKTITPAYQAMLEKYHFWDRKPESTACASYVSIYFAEKYGDIPVTASVSNLLSSLQRNSNYVYHGIYNGDTSSFVPDTILIWKYGTYSHVVIWVGDEVTGMPGCDTISASLNSRGPVPRPSIPSAAIGHAYIYTHR